MMISLVGAFLDDPVWKIQEDAAIKADKADRRLQNIEKSVENTSTFLEKVKVFIDFSHFKNRNFALLGLTTFLIYAFYNTAIYYLTEMLRNLDYTEIESARFLSVIGFFLMIGMVTLGWIDDQKYVNVILLNSGCVLSCGLSEALMPLASNTFALSILCAVFGFTFASAYVLIPKIAELIVGVDNFASAIGLNFFMQGLGLLVGTPFASLIYETTQR